MQLAGPGVFGPPRDRGAALAVLRRAIELGVDHVDTSQYYGPDVVNELIREALHPIPRACASSRRSARGATIAARGFRRCGRRSCGRAGRTTPARSGSPAWRL